MTRVLALDGGGIRGIIQAITLDKLEQTAGKSTQELFSMFVGTSTGGILALALATGRKPEDIIRLYEKRGCEIFSKPWYWLGVTDAKYSAKGIEKVLQEELGEAPIASASFPVAVTSFSLGLRDTVIISSWDRTINTMPIWQAARATSAAPSFFSSFGPRMLIDGGVWANNPSRVALDIARRRHPGEQFQLLSIGTGDQRKNYRKSPGWGLLGWAGHGVSLLMDAPLKQVERECERELGGDYVRIQVPFHEGHWPMDCGSGDYIERLKDAAAHAETLVEQLVRQEWFV